MFKRACYCFLCTARWIQPTDSYPFYVDIHFNITLRICLYLTSLFKFSCQGSVTFLICLACNTIHPICPLSNIFLQSVQTGSRTQPASYSMSIVGDFPGDKGAEAWCWPLTQSKADVMDEWRYNSTLSKHLPALYWYKFTLTQYLRRTNRAA